MKSITKYFIIKLEIKKRRKTARILMKGINVMVTIKDIAKASGVSASTVSIILNGKSQERKISQKTCERVWEAVRSLGYQPNIAARTLRDTNDNDTRTIALYWANDFRTTMLSRFLKGLERARENAAIPCEITIYPYENDRLHEQTPLLSGKRFHAAIIANASAADMDFIKNSIFPIPLALYNRQLEGIYSVTVDNARMGSLAASALLGRGKKWPWILTSDSTFPGMELRISGFLETMAAQGVTIPKEHILHGHGTPEAGASMTEALLSHKDHCDSIYCLSDAIAYGCLHTLNLHNIAIPGEISVVSIGNGEKDYAMYATPSLSTVYLPMEDMASHCLKALLDLLCHKTPRETNLLLDTPLFMRTS